MSTFNRRRFALLLALGLLLAALAGCGGDGMTVVFPKIGSADAALIFTSRATILLDTGESDDAQEILSLLEDYGRKSIDLLLISHYDKDHVGGAAEILGSVPVKRVIGSALPKDSQEYAAYQQALKDAGLKEERPAAPMQISLGGMTLTIDPPQGRYETDASNNASTIVTLRYGDTSLLFLGDAMAQRLSEEDFPQGAYDLIKIPHHGRDPENVPLYIGAARSGGYGIVTSSKKNPEADALCAALERGGVTPYLTRQGDIVVTSNGRSLTAEQDKTA